MSHAIGTPPSIARQRPSDLVAAVQIHNNFAGFRTSRAISFLHHEVYEHPFERFGYFQELVHSLEFVEIGRSDV